MGIFVNIIAQNVKPNGMRHPFIELPKNVELALFMIQAELKTRKFFNGLRSAGLDDCDYECNFNALIADCIGFDDYEDKDFVRFDEILERHSEKIEMDNESLMKQVMNAYVELIVEKNNQQRHSTQE